MRGAPTAVRFDGGTRWFWWGQDADRVLAREVWKQRGTLANRCYDKLFAANVPFFFDLESYRPQWTPLQLRVLRRVLGSACHVIRAASR